MFLKTAVEASELSLCLTVFFCSMSTGRTGSAGIPWWHGDEPAAVPGQLVVQLSPELKPALVKDGFIQPGLGPDVFPRCFNRSPRRSRHILNLQVLDTHYRVVFADSGRGFMQIVVTSVGNSNMQPGQFSFLFFPVG